MKKILKNLANLIKKTKESNIIQKEENTEQIVSILKPNTTTEINNNTIKEESTENINNILSLDPDTESTINNKEYSYEDHKEIIDITFNMKDTATSPDVVQFFQNSGLSVYRNIYKILQEKIMVNNSNEKDLKECQKFQLDMTKILNHIASTKVPLEYKLQTSEDLQIGKKYKFVITGDMLGYLNTPYITMTIGETSTEHKTHTMNYIKDVYTKNNPDGIYSKDKLPEIMIDLNTLKGGFVEKINDNTIKFYGTSGGLGSPSNILVQIIAESLFPGYKVLTELD